MPTLSRWLLVGITAFLPFLSWYSLAEPATLVSWAMLMDQEAQTYEDPCRDLTGSQMERLMDLAAIQQSQLGGEPSATDIEKRRERAATLEHELRSEGLDAYWILAQGEVVAARRLQAAVATNSELTGRVVELTGYFLNTSSQGTGERVTYLVPNRGVCMHLPAPAPNLLVSLVVEELPDPIGPVLPQ